MNLSNLISSNKIRKPLHSFANTNSAAVKFEANFNKAFSGPPNPADECNQTIGKHLVQSDSNTFAKLEKALRSNMLLKV